MVDDNKNADTADQAAGSDDEPSTLVADMTAKMAALQEDVVEGDDDVSSDTDDVKTDQVDTEDQKDEDLKDDSSILPAGHRRAALARGYTNEEIDYHLETKPDEAVVLFAEVFDRWQEQSSRWSDRGRQLVKAGQEVSEREGDKDKGTSEALSHYDANALVEEHGSENEALIKALVDPLNTVIDRVNAATERLSSSEEFLQGTRENALATVTQDFFKSKGMEASKEVFGLEIKDLTNDQVEKRMELFKEADIIAAGAEAHGENVTAQEALERAFAIVSQGTRDEIIQQTIRDSMKKRTKTTRSSHQQTSVPDENQPISDEELEKRTDARLRALRDKR